MKTKRGIYLDINESDITFKEDNDIVFYFSSEFNKKRFISSYKDYIKNETLRVNTRYDVNSEFDLLYEIALYKKIEKRGFKIEYNKEIIKEYDDCYIIFRI